MNAAAWPRSIWSEARQVTQLNGWPEMEGDGDAPAAFFDRLCAEGRKAEAVLFLAQALPRLEAISWAAGTIQRIPGAQPAARMPALSAVDAWINHPVDTNRRRAWDLAGPIDPPAAATLCALAVFHAGGSIAPLDTPASPPPRGSVGRFAGAAILVAVSMAAQPDHELSRALEEGVEFARAPLERVR